MKGKVWCFDITLQSKILELNSMSCHAQGINPHCAVMRHNVLWSLLGLSSVCLLSIIHHSEETPVLMGDP